MKLRPRLLLLALFALVAGACSVPTDETVNAVDPEDLPAELQPTVATTTTTLPAGEEVTIYLYNQETELLQPVTRRVENATLRATIEALFQARPTLEERAQGLVTELPTEEDAEPLELIGPIDTVNNDSRVVLTVRGTISGENQSLVRAFAQIVFTASQLDAFTNARSEVAINSADDGERIEIPLQDDTQKWADRGDYPELDPELAPTTTTTTSTTSTTSSTTTSVPPSTTQRSRQVPTTLLGG